jgi:cation:H+ antiporter
LAAFLAYGWSMMRHIQVLILAESFSAADVGHWMGLLYGAGAASTTTANVLLVLLGMMAITKGGDLFTGSAVTIARATRISPALIGATIVSLATTFPEFVVAVTGVLRGSASLGVGNALGSCCCNIGLIIGSCAIINGLLAHFRGTDSGLVASRQMLAGPGLFMMAGGIALWAFSASGHPPLSARHQIAGWEGLALGLLLVVYLVYSAFRAIRQSHASGPAVEEAKCRPQLRGVVGRQLLVFMLGAGLVCVGSRVLIENAAQIARTFHVSELVIGLTILAVGTSLPEYTVAIMAVIKGQSSLGIGNIIGANVLNICGVVATCAVITPLPIDGHTLMLDVPAVLILMAMLPLIAWKSERISPWGGAMLVCVYTSYMAVL